MDDGATYNALGQPLLLPLGGSGLDWQIKNDYYDDDQRLQRIQAGPAGSQDRDLFVEYQYDAVGNVALTTDKRLGQVQYQDFDYDALDRLTGAHTSGAGTWGVYTETYAYNEVGNLRSKGGVSYDYNDVAHKHAVTSTGNGGSFSYDANGNMTQRIEGGVTYQQTWDYENRLASVTANGQTTTFTYDGNGVLVKKGNKLPLEGFGDSFVNALLLGYDAQRAGGNLPTYVELVCSESGCQWVIYLNETPQEEPLESDEEDEHQVE